MFFPNSPKHRMLLGIVGPSAAFGGFLMMALLLFDKPYSSVELRLISLGCYLFLAGMSFNLAIQTCRKVLKLFHEATCCTRGIRHTPKRLLASTQKCLVLFTLR